MKRITILQYPHIFHRTIPKNLLSELHYNEFNTSLHKIMSLWILWYSLSKFYILMNSIFITMFLLPSRRFKKGQHPTSMIQNIVFFNSHRQHAKTCPIQINASCKLQRSLQDKLCSTRVTLGPPLHFVQVQIYYPRHMRSTLIH
jgi:hypothetical protein